MFVTKPTCAVVPAAQIYHGKQGLTYFSGIATETVGSREICMHLVTIPPGARGTAHLHRDHETALYVLSGGAETWCGEGLQERLVVRNGEFLYIPAGLPHVPINTSQTEPCIAVLARTDPSEQESVVLLPDLDALAPWDPR